MPVIAGCTMQLRRKVPAASAGTWYVVDATPVMIAPLNCTAPAPVATVTLWGMAASLLVNRIPNGTPAGPSTELGEKRKSRASMARMTGATVGTGVGLAVGLTVGLTVGFGVGLAVGVGAGVGRRVGAGVAAGDGVSLGAVGDGVLATGDAVALGASVGEGRTVGEIVGATLAAAMDADADLATDETGATVAALDADGPHAARDRPTTTSSSPAAPGRGVRETGIAAL